jgi:hypothetical protein
MLQLAYQCQLALEWHPASHVIICVAAMVAIVLGGAVFYRFSAQMGWTEALLKAWMYVYNSPGEGLSIVKGLHLSLVEGILKCPLTRSSKVHMQ